MKQKVVFTTLLFCAFMLTSLDSNCQEKDQMYIVWENQVFPGKQEQYKEALKKQAILLEKHKYSYPYFVFSTNDYFYYLATPIDNMATLDEMYKEWFKIKSEMLNDGFNHDEAFKGSNKYILPQIITWSAKLSYNPAEARIDNEKPYFLRWHFCYLFNGHDSDFFEKHIKYIEEFKKHNAISGFDTYIGGFGTETPCVIWIERYKNEMDMLETRKKLFESVGSDYREIWIDMKNDIRKVETKTGWYRPGLSYIPEI